MKSKESAGSLTYAAIQDMSLGLFQVVVLSGGHICGYADFGHM